MSNTYVNIRFGSWHFQILKDPPWVTFTRNPYHDIIRKEDPDWKWFEWYR